MNYYIWELDWQLSVIWERNIPILIFNLIVWGLLIFCIGDWWSEDSLVVERNTCREQSLKITPQNSKGNTSEVILWNTHLLNLSYTSDSEERCVQVSYIKSNTSSLTLLGNFSISILPENFKKPVVFWHFQGV